MSDLISKYLVQTAFIAVMIVVACLPSFASPYKAFFESDLDRDGRVERIELDSEREMTLQITRSGRSVWSGVPSKWKPWKLQIADVDGDGKPEIAIGVFKSTKFFPKPHNCLFIYGWSGDEASPKWLGSSLGRPFTEFLFADLNDVPGDELLAIETSRDSKPSIAVYRWDSFGFTLVRRHGEWARAEILDADRGRISIVTDGGTIVLPFDQ